jgi:thiamine-monophosphate kinase
MSGPDVPLSDGSGGPVDEFDWIEKLLRPLTRGAPEALNLLDDAAALPARPGYDLIVTKDALVEGVHFLSDDPPANIARKLLRCNLSDLAAKGAEPYGYFLAVAWPPAFGWEKRRAFVAGLDADQTAFGLVLLGGDTVSTPGPLTLSATLMGWTPAGAMMRRGAAKVGDVVFTTGTIGDGWLGLRAARDGALGLSEEDLAWLIERYRTPQPRLGLGDSLRRYAHAAADVSDGLIADVGRIGIASGLGVSIALDRLPLSPAAQRWLSTQSDLGAALLALAVGGDDYEIVCTAPKAKAAALEAAVRAAGLSLTSIGEITAGTGVRVVHQGHEIDAGAGGYRHR